MTTTKKTITNLTSESVSILTQQFKTVKETFVNEVTGETEVVEREIQIGDNYRCAYTNSESGRAMFMEREPEDTIAEVVEVWGDAPTVEEPNYDDCVQDPTLEDRVRSIEETLAQGGGSNDVWTELANAIQEGVNEV